MSECKPASQPGERSGRACDPLSEKPFQEGEMEGEGAKVEARFLEVRIWCGAP